MTALVLDTCAVLAIGGKLAFRSVARRALRHAVDAGTAYLPSVAASEIAQKVAARKLRLGPPHQTMTPRDWIDGLLVRDGLAELQVSITAALHAYELPEPFHKDPADRLIVAMARLLTAPIVTIDRRILDYANAGHVAAIAY